MLWQFGPPMSALGLQDIIKTVSIIICIGSTGLRLRHIGKTDPQCGTVRFCFPSGRFTCSARTGFGAVTTTLSGGSNILGVRLATVVTWPRWGSRVRYGLGGRGCVTTLGKLFTPSCLGHCAFDNGQSVAMSELCCSADRQTIPRQNKRSSGVTRNS